MILASLKLDASLAELRVSVIRCDSEVNLPFELQQFDNFHVADYCVVLFFVVRYSLNPLSKKCHFGHIGGADPNLMFVFQVAAPIFTLKLRKH